MDQVVPTKWQTCVWCWFGCILLGHMEDKELDLFSWKESKIPHKDHMFNLLLVNILVKTLEVCGLFQSGAQRRGPEVGGPAFSLARSEGRRQQPRDQVKHPAVSASERCVVWK